MMTVNGRSSQVSAEGSKLIVGELEAVLESASDAERILALFKPDIRPSLSSAAQSASAFLEVKGKALSLMLQLEANPREVLLRSFDELSGGAAPVESIVAESQRDANAAVQQLEVELDRVSQELPWDDTRQRMFAAVYAVGLFHDSVIRGDRTSQSQALKLLREACPGGDYSVPEETSDIRPEDLSQALLQKGFEALAVLA
jgi:hypothetical protein